MIDGFVFDEIIAPNTNKQNIENDTHSNEDDMAGGFFIDDNESKY